MLLIRIANSRLPPRDRSACTGTKPSDGANHMRRMRSLPVRRLETMTVSSSPIAVLNLAVPSCV